MVAGRRDAPALRSQTSGEEPQLRLFESIPEAILVHRADGVLFANAACLLMLGAGAYEQIVVSYSWQTRPEEAVGHYRALGAIVTPARFFRRLAPLSQITLVVLVIWSAVRGVALVWTGTALAAMALADVITFTFHYPRNRALFIELNPPFFEGRYFAPAFSIFVDRLLMRHGQIEARALGGGQVGFEIC